MTPQSFTAFATVNGFAWTAEMSVSFSRGNPDPQIANVRNVTIYVLGHPFVVAPDDVPDDVLDGLAVDAVKRFLDLKAGELILELEEIAS